MEEIKTRTIKDCWNLCETNSIIKCDAISFQSYKNIFYVFTTEFFKEKKLSKKPGFTTLIRSKLIKNTRINYHFGI